MQNLVERMGGTNTLYKRAYMLFALLGLMSVSASFILGFRFDPAAPAGNYLYDIELYVVFIAVHILMTMPAFKRVVYRDPAGTPAERRIYVAVSIITWLAVYWLHKPVPGFGLWAGPGWMVFLGLCGILLALVAFFEFATIDRLCMLVAVPGYELSHTTGVETPLMTEGSYSDVRHPMYRAFFYLAASSLIMHPNTGQLLFALMVWLSFIVFIPFEERQLIKARGAQYLEYQQRVPYRVFRGIW